MLGDQHLPKQLFGRNLLDKDKRTYGFKGKTACLKGSLVHGVFIRCPVNIPKACYSFRIETAEVEDTSLGPEARATEANRARDAFKCFYQRRKPNRTGSTRHSTAQLGDVHHSDDSHPPETLGNKAEVFSHLCYTLNGIEQPTPSLTPGSRRSKIVKFIRLATSIE